MRNGLNQHPPMIGVPALRDAIAAKLAALYGHRYDAASEITVTAGATQAILTAVLAIVHPGDEVIVLDPCYDSYDPNITLAGGCAVHVPLTPRTFRPDFDAIGAALTPRTRAIIVNTPHNPSATVWSSRGTGSAPSRSCGAWRCWERPWSTCARRPTLASRSRSRWSACAGLMPTRRRPRWPSGSNDSNEPGPVARLPRLHPVPSADADGRPIPGTRADKA